MAEQAQRRPRTPRLATVLRTSRPTPHLVRLVLGGEGLTGFAPQHTDSYVKLVLPPAGAPYAAPFDMEEVRSQQPAELWPCLRTYTVRAWDADRGELTLDVVVHGDEGVAGPWAVAARPGDAVQLLGPGGDYVPADDADWHLLVGDESALPAIAVSLERLPAGVPALVFVEVDGPAEEQDLAVPAGVELQWVHRAGAPGSALVAAVLTAEFPEGSVHAFVHGEAGFVRDLRRFLRVERLVPRERLSASGYWRLGRTDEGWRAEKAEWVAAVEADEQRLPVA
ncbi:siderophore-interacting protein [Geodermatophilus sabuli]|uniref:NADPH-dependent ferric siderophore reductase, contains FAD-binding and SIP domains n=1 Tax=Geodermatophilus sabuli TaxID=1564158 RepID=A0A285E7X4_9ACTN|nr:siderophore-interacting protein [Geodermatophilus sabuli]MBB3082821.1 NADPH-dependent ferric siderophore reductase [Geodermatophilus sabuli]SNX94314.1 NADPH-dependent ferric siderophore reductase, contains FAD-binding and SIP domains [Geodermatophilus sabuli]